MKQFLTIVLVLLVVWFLWKNKPLTRVELIDWLNINLGNANGQWVNMTKEELQTVYKTYYLVKRNVVPSTEDYLKANEVLKKYNIAL